jgi:hypothetical protein
VRSPGPSLASHPALPLGRWRWTPGEALTPQSLSFPTCMMGAAWPPEGRPRVSACRLEPGLCWGPLALQGFWGDF